MHSYALATYFVVYLFDRCGFVDAFVYSFTSVDLPCRLTKLSYDALATEENLFLPYLLQLGKYASVWVL